MLKVTNELIDTIRSAPGSSSNDILANARVALVARRGSVEDAGALLDVFLEDPTDPRRASALDAVMRVGDRDTAHRMASTCLVDGGLRAGTHEAVLHALGFLGYTDVRDVLWQYARDSTDFYQQRAAVLGLLNLSCNGLEHEIETAIRSCVGKSLFPEFIPALAHKVGNPELLQTIFDTGRTDASVDCNSGIVYGIALFGAAGRPHFDQLLFDPSWEAYGGGTGTNWWTHHGFRHLGGSLTGLAHQIRAWHATMPFKECEYRTRIWLELAKCWLHDPLPPLRDERHAPERAADVYRAAFDWSSANTDDSLIGLLRDEGVQKNKMCTLRDRISDRITAEVFHGGWSQPTGE